MERQKKKLPNWREELTHVEVRWQVGNTDSKVVWEDFDFQMFGPHARRKPDEYVDLAALAKGKTQTSDVGSPSIQCPRLSRLT